MKVEQIVCDVCGARQGKGIDGWWHLILSDRFNLFKAIRGDKRPENPMVLDLCSAQCAAKKLNEFMMPEKQPMHERPQEKHYDIAESKTKVDEVHWKHLPPSLQANVIMCIRCQGKGKLPKDERLEHEFIVTAVDCPRCKGTGIEP